jgi:hypothetical protein
MANQRSTFTKRNREMKLKDRAREKAERREARKTSPTESKGPQIAWDEAGGTANTAITGGDEATTPPADDSTDTTDTTDP